MTELNRKSRTTYVEVILAEVPGTEREDFILLLPDRDVVGWDAITDWMYVNDLELVQACPDVYEELPCGHHQVVAYSLFLREMKPEGGV